MGSALMHGSHTHVGGRFDNIMISMIAYISHQISIEHIPGGSSVLRELSKTPRKRSAEQEVERMTDMLINKDINQWPAIIESTDIQHRYYITFAALIAGVCGLIFPWWLVEMIIPPLAKQFVKNENERSFYLDLYLPELKEAIQHVEIGFIDKFFIWRRFMACLMKTFDSFIWQE